MTITINSESTAARGAAFRVLRRVESGDAFANILLDKELGDLSNLDKGLATELVYGILRWQTKIDWIIESYSSIKVRKLEHSVLTALRMGIYQLLFLTKIPPSAAINESVNLVKKEGQKKAGFVNGVLRSADAGRKTVPFPSLQKEPNKYISVVFSHPEWMVKRWIERWGIKETLDICQGNLKVPSTYIRANTLINSREELTGQLREEGFTLKETPLSPMGIEVISAGEGQLDTSDPRYYIQDEASQLVPLLLAPEGGELILDACAAPGGKTTEIGAMMENKGKVFALEIHEGRVKVLKEQLSRMGVTNTEVHRMDSTKASVHTLSVEDFDGILLDAPCSGLGVLRRSPDIKYRRREEDINELQMLQLSLLRNLSKYLKVKGRIVYSTCSLEAEETEEVIENFLRENENFVLESASLYLPEGCSHLVGQDGYLKTKPSKDSTDGFFGARLKRLS